MISAYLDKNLCSRKLVDACNRRGGAEVQFLPRHLRELLDPDLLPQLVQIGRLLVTNDRSIAEESASWMPLLNPGIVIVEDDYGQNRTMTWKLTLAILGDFKNVFSVWPETPCNNSVISLSPSYITLFHFSGSSLHFDQFYDRSVSGWETTLEREPYTEREPDVVNQRDSMALPAAP